MSMHVIVPSVLYGAAALIFLGLPALLSGFRKTGFCLLLGGFTLWTVFLLNRVIFTGEILQNAFFEESFFLPWCMALMTLVVGRPGGKNPSNVSLVAPTCLTVIWALIAPLGVQSPSPFMGSGWPPFFFAFEGLGHAFFLAAAWLALLYLIDRKNGEGFRAFMAWGFVCYSLAQVVGAIWSYLGWGTPFHWNVRHLESAALWCFYAASLHLRFTDRWTPRRDAWLALVGLAILVLFVLSGLIGESHLSRIGGQP